MSDLHPSALLADRVERLEAQTVQLRRDASRMKLLAMLARAALVGVPGIGAAAVTHSAPMAFTDTNGHTRMRLDAGGLHLYDTAGKERIMIGYNSKGQPAIHLNDKYGTERESLYLDAAQEPIFAQFDKTENTRAEYYVSNTDGSAQISLQGVDGSSRFFVHANDLPYLSLGDKGYNQRAYLGLTNQGSGLLRYLGGNNRANMGFFSGGAQGIQFNDAAGTLLWARLRSVRPACRCGRRNRAGRSTSPVETPGSGCH
ncbi:MAG: hypothetical protein M3R30_01375 [Candidatus Eremiobacteraeota bacterium]|nr:hypothetical protein [Candidatus Eremiobacteraeota bacterium]